MIKVITYGTFDMIHYGHYRLLERAKALGDHLIVGITSDSFDKQRGKINVSQSLMQRIENVKKTNLADEIIVEEYVGQKIDDIKKYNIDIFTIGSDWLGQFDYLNEYCKVVYLDRTIGVSSTEIRDKNNLRNIALLSRDTKIKEIYDQAHFVNGVEISGICTNSPNDLDAEISKVEHISDNYKDIIDYCDCAYITDEYTNYEICKYAITNKKDIICSLPLKMSFEEYKELKILSSKLNTSFNISTSETSSSAFNHFVSILKSKSIGDILSINIKTNLMNQEPLSKLSGAIAFVTNIFGDKFNYKQVKIESNFAMIYLSWDNGFATIETSNALTKNDNIFVHGTNGIASLNSPWEKSGHISIKKTSDEEAIHQQYDGIGIKYEFLNLIKGNNSFIDDKTMEALYNIIY